MRLGIGLLSLLLAGLIAGALAVFSACDAGSAPGTATKTKVVTSLPLFADLARQVGGDLLG